MVHCATSSSERCPWPWWQDWNWIIFQVPSNPSHSMTLWKPLFRSVSTKGTYSHNYGYHNNQPNRKESVLKVVNTLKWKPLDSICTDRVVAMPLQPLNSVGSETNPWFSLNREKTEFSLWQCYLPTTWPSLRSTQKIQHSTVKVDYQHSPCTPQK